MDTASSETLSEQNTQLVRENKKLQRALARLEDQIRRNQITDETKSQFYEVVKSERSRLELNMNLLLANIRDYILFFDTDDKLQYCSESFVRAINAASSALLKDKFMHEILGDLIPQENIVQITELARSFAKGEPSHNLEMHLQADLDKSGVLRDYSVEVNILVNEEGGSEGVVMLLYDTTELASARREAEQANAIKSDFLATISHEIRTPMNAVIGLTGMLEETRPNVRQADLIGRIKISSTNLLDIINDLLDFSKIEAGKLDIVDDYFDFLELLAGVESLFMLMMSQKGLEFVTDFASDLPRVVYSDGKRVRQIMVNLLNNAYKYTPQGTVTFKAYRLNSDGLKFEISDTGIGIKEEERHKLFKEFAQLDQVRNKHVTGTGLGLAITKRLCDLMAGSIEVQSVYGQGSTFGITLPLKAGTAEDLSHSEAEAPVFTAKKARILIVDDVEVNLEITRFMLEPFGVQTQTALDGREAIKLIEAERFDLVLMDHMMPIMDGVEATQIIRRREREKAQVAGETNGQADGQATRQATGQVDCQAAAQAASRIPIVALTANAISGVEEMFKSEGFDGFISKPVDVKDLAWSLYDLLPRELID